MSAWSALEMACEHALGSIGVGRRFKENLDSDVKKASLPPLDWDAGIWQKVGKTHTVRTQFVHLNLSQERLFAELQEAEEVIEIIREAIGAIYVHAGKLAPSWLADDEDPGWEGGTSVTMHAAIVRSGVNPEAPDTLRLAYVYKEREYVTDYLPKDTDIDAAIDDLVQRMNLPITAIRVYLGKDLVRDQPLQMRGA